MFSVGGLCAGVAYYFGIPTWILRVALVLASLTTDLAVCVVYLLLWIFVPRAATPADYVDKTGDG